MENEYSSTSSGNNKKRWNAFIIENKGLFLQSWEWGEFQKSLGRKIWRLRDGENWAALIIRYDLPMGKNYLYCPAGPLLNEKGKIKNEKLQVKIQKFLDETKRIAKNEKSIFLKIEPFAEINLKEDCPPSGGQSSKCWIDSGFQKSDGGQRILETLVLDLEKSEEQLLAGMKQKTRYNIRLAEKHGVIIRISDNPEKDFEGFWKLASETSDRDDFRLHPKGYYLKQLSFCHPKQSEGSHTKDSSPAAQNDNLCVKLFLAVYQDKVIAANIVVFFGDRAIYLHGASSNESRNLMAPYLLQWEQIKEAKKRGCGIYDFWGIDEVKWPGVTRFKKGFGGNEIDYIGTYDYVFDKVWYKLYELAKRIY
jgi:lipid II:glycine glycyltransferase (peptidoglycan interpeptide bridge formation enzyme)